MKTKIVQYLLTTVVAFGTMTPIHLATAAEPATRLLGLAMHQETGRNIYLGAIHVGKDTPNPGSLDQVAPPLKMEYRVVARRTSVRSLLGSMLLQSEVASGTPPSDASINFADHLMSSVQGSLYAGDSLAVVLDKQQQISVYLNDQEMTSAADNGVFRYLLVGWTNENGPTTEFRESILRTDVDGSLYSAYEAHQPTAERIALVSQWSNGAEAEEPVQVAAAEDKTEDLIATQATAAPAVASTESETTETTEQSVEEVFEEVFEESSDPVPADEPAQQVASAAAVELEPTSAGMSLSTAAVSDEIQAMNVTEYSHRLAGFNTAIIKLVYSKIQYPRRAVRRDIQGALELDITMTEDGSLVEVAVAESSGFSILDGAAVEAAEQALAKSMGQIDAVAIAEYGGDGRIVVPVPVNFILQ